MHEISMRVEAIADDIEGLSNICSCIASSDDGENCSDAAALISRLLGSLCEELRGVAEDLIYLKCRAECNTESLC